VAELLATLGSVVTEETMAVLVMLPSPPGGTEYVDVIIAVAPEASVPRLQGNAVIHVPLFETNRRPAGVGSLTETACAGDGPLFMTVMVKVAFCPAIRAVLSAFVIDRSAVVVGAEPGDPDAELELFALLGSGVIEDTLAEFVIVPFADGDTEYVDVIETLEPAASVPSEHGNVVVHAPLLETNVKPAGVGSLIDTACESDGPLLVTVIVNVAFWPATKAPFKTVAIARSALVVTV